MSAVTSRTSVPRAITVAVRRWRLARRCRRSRRRRRGTATGCSPTGAGRSVTATPTSTATCPDTAQRPDHRLGRDPDRPRLLHGRFRRRRLQLRRRPLPRLDRQPATEQTRRGNLTDPGQPRLLAGRIRRWRVRVRRIVPRVDGRHQPEQAGQRPGRVRQRLPDGRERRRRVRLLEQGILRQPRGQPSTAPIIGIAAFST